MYLKTNLWLIWLQLKNQNIPYFSWMKPVKLEFKFILAISTSRIIPKYEFQVFAAKKRNQMDLYNVMNVQKNEYKNLWSPEPFK